jgi:hypothetical protein
MVSLCAEMMEFGAILMGKLDQNHLALHLGKIYNAILIPEPRVIQLACLPQDSELDFPFTVTSWGPRLYLLDTWKVSLM